MTERFDVVIVGAGMAGASLAAELAGRASVLLIEAEERPGYHTTGRSAALWHETYGGAGVQPLTTASGPYLREHGFLRPRGALTLGRQGEESAVTDFARRFAARGVAFEIEDRAAIAARVPGLRAEWTCGAYEPTCADIDVSGLHQHYLAIARRSGAVLWLKARLEGAERRDTGWRLTMSDGRTAQCRILANAAGAWADEVALLGSAAPMGIAPLRRTMVQLRTEPGPSADLPMVRGVDDSFYFKPEAGRLWLSPHDEIPSLPCDAAPEELDVAIAIDRFEQVVDWRIEQVEHKWAGLRSFAPDRLPVYGFDPRAPGFFWFAGQGGFGIQTAPAAARLAAALLLGEGGGEVDPGPYTVERFG